MIDLRLYNSLLQGASFQADLTERAQGWKRTIRRQGGYWLGSFVLNGSERDLIQAFQTWLGFHMIERDGMTPTWEGMIYELDLTLGGVTRRRSLDTLYNHVISVYDNSGTATDTSAATLDASISKFGRREQRLTGSSGFPQTAAEKYRDSYLAEYGWAVPRAVGIGRGADRLEVTLAGYIHTAAWRYESAGDGSDDDLDDWVTEIITTDCPYLEAYRIAANTLQVTKDTATPTRAWDVLKLLADMGDASGNRYRLHVGNEQRVYYEAIDTAPAYYLDRGNLSNKQGGLALSQWQIQPGVVRDYSYTGGDDYEGWLDSGKDFYVDEVEASADGFTLKASEFEESSIIANQARYQQMLERMNARD